MVGVERLASFIDVLIIDENENISEDSNSNEEDTGEETQLSDEELSDSVPLEG